MKKAFYLSFLLTLLMVSSSVFAQTDLTGATVTLNPSSYDYDGTAHCPKVSGIRKGTRRYNTLVEGTDYDITYTNNVNAGEATATLTFKGNYTGTTTKIFTINPIDLTREQSVVMKLNEDLFVYDGTEKTPGASVWYGDIKFVSGVDFDLTYENNVNIGTATAIATLKGNYSGSKKASFYIIDPNKPIDPEAKDVTIDETNFPDANFRSWLKSQSYGSDGVLTVGELISINSILVKDKDIQSLKGIEYFMSLTTLNCSGNQLTALDVSKNTELQYLSCEYNQISSLDLSKNKGLITLDCFNNKLASLNVSGCTELNRLYCYKNQIKVSAMGELIASLPTVSEGRMYVVYSANENEGNKITIEQTNLAKSKGWTICYYSSSWKEYGESSSAIDINEANFPDKNFRNYLLGKSYMLDGKLTDEDIANIKSINVEGLGIESLKGIELFTELTSLNCGGNKLTSLDLSKNTALIDLSCFSNQLTSLDLSNNAALKTLYCYDNQLTSVDLADGNSLITLVCYSNQLRGNALTKLIDKLPTVSNYSIQFMYNENENNVMYFEQAAAAKVKGWTPMYFDGNDWRIYYGIETTDIRGDANNDGIVNGTDIQAVINLIVSNEYEEKADVNKDKIVNGTDIQEIINIIVNGDSPEKEYFYMGTTKPTADNYKSLPGLVSDYTSLGDAVGTKIQANAGDSISMLFPESWLVERNIALEDENGKRIILYLTDNCIISGTEYYIIETEALDTSCNVELKSESIRLTDIVDSDPDVKIYTEALKLTKLSTILEECEDREYRKKYVKYKGNFWTDEDFSTGDNTYEFAYYPSHRYYGFTAFMVKDETLEKYNSLLTSHHFNATGNMDENILALAELASKYYSTSVPYTSTDYANPEHPLYQFMAYHILDRNVQYYHLLTVRGDMGINTEFVNPTDWYTTCLPYSMIKIQHLTVGTNTDNGAGDWLGTGVQGDYYINRNYNKNNSIEGVHVQPVISDQDNYAANGTYFYIDDILTFDQATIDNVFNTRIRMDFSTIFPEIMSNNIRMNGSWTDAGTISGRNFRFPQGYLSGVTLNNDETRLIYRYPRSRFYSMNGDEMLAQNQFDITFTLPPVPFTGDWQIRLGFAPMNVANDWARNRGVAQIYLDDDDEGTTVDFSKTLDEVRGMSRSEWNNIRYADLRQDEEKRLEDFNILKNQGYYRGPHSVFYSSNRYMETMINTFSQLPNAARVVLCTVHMEAGKPHTIRIKNNVMGLFAKNKEAVLDYLELVPKSVYEATEGDNVEDDL